MPHIFGSHLSSATQLSKNILPFIARFTFTTRLTILRIIATPAHVIHEHLFVSMQYNNKPFCVT